MAESRSQSMVWNSSAVNFLKVTEGYPGSSGCEVVEAWIGLAMRNRDRWAGDGGLPPFV